MAVTARARHQLFKKLEKVLGMEEAGTLIDLVPPMGWGDLATKQDLEALRVATKHDIDLLRSDFKEELTTKLRGLFFAISALFLGVVTLLLTVPHLI